MIPCPTCGTGSSAVLDSRPRRGGVRRMRRCVGCGHRYSTFEAIPIEPINPRDILDLTKLNDYQRSAIRLIYNSFRR